MNLTVIGGLLENIFEEGLIYGIMAVGVYITYSILDFPDLTVDGSFPLGSCIAAAMIGAVRLGGSEGLAMACGVLVVVLIRWLAAHFCWNLPRIPQE